MNFINIFHAFSAKRKAFVLAPAIIGIALAYSSYQRDAKALKVIMVQQKLANMTQAVYSGRTAVDLTSADDARYEESYNRVLASAAVEDLEFVVIGVGLSLAVGFLLSRKSSSNANKTAA